MFPVQISGIQYCLAPESPTQLPANFGMMQANMPQNFHLNSLLANLPNSLIPPLGHELMTSQSSSLSNNSTSDESEDQQQKIIDERKQRRMVSNRESARRSRMRKQKQLDELWSHVARLKNVNHNLIGRLNHVSECHDRVLQENSRLKEEASNLRQMLIELQTRSPCINASLSDLEEVPCNTSHLGAESTNQSITNSVDLLH